MKMVVVQYTGHYAEATGYTFTQANVSTQSSQVMNTVKMVYLKVGENDIA